MLSLRKVLKAIANEVNMSGAAHKCNVCNSTFQRFNRYKEGSKSLPSFMVKLNIVGSDLDNFQCPKCKANDRERHLFMFFDTIKFWEKIADSHILHFAPEKKLPTKIISLNPKKYVRADLSPRSEEVEAIDATSIPFYNESFDIVICNHVLEHIPNYKMALSEIFRVLKPGGVAILQTPFSKVLHQNIEDKGINSDELRNFFYGEKDHFRIFSETQLLKDFIEAGFELQTLKHSKWFDTKTTRYFGVNKEEDLVQVVKPLR